MPNMSSALMASTGFAESPVEQDSRLEAGFPAIESGLPTRPLLTDLSVVGKITSLLFGSKNPFRTRSTPERNRVWVLDNTAVVSSNPTAGGLQQWQAEFISCHFVQGRKDITEVVSYFADLIGIDGQAGSDAEVRDRIETRLQPFVHQIAPAHTIEVSLSSDTGKSPLKRILGPTNSNGISSNIFSIEGNDASGGETLRVTSPGFDNISANLRFVGAEGWAVLSDIDDTIKITGTTDPTWVLRSTLADIPEPCEGMPEFFQMLNQKLSNPAWFYVSASPYNLYPFLREFVLSTYPQGDIALRESSWMSFGGLLQSFTVGVQEYKVGRGTKIQSWLPKRKFICIGDSTQADPESYAELYNKHPGWIKAIYIRTPTDLPHMKQKNSPERFAKAFKGIPTSIWKTFVVPSELVDHLNSVVDPTRIIPYHTSSFVRVFAFTMPQAFDRCKERPQHIDDILRGLNRYNPETTTTFQEYVSQQCEDKFFDAYACLALLKLYQFNPHLLHPETVTNILVKALTVFPSPAFSLCLALFPASSIPYGSDIASIPTTELTESIQKLTKLNTLLESAQYDAFWSTLESDDIYADLYADVAGFEDLVRIRIAGEVGKTFREIDLSVLSGWLNLRSDALVKFCQTACGWRVSGEKVEIPANAENEAKSEIKGERVGVEMFGRVFRRGYEDPA
ncbi:hypothetical protein DV735_g3037, partial [Chaetothyriales sp. CBS 134920]